jgi:hypothetical protein
MEKPSYITRSKWNSEQGHVAGRMAISGQSKVAVAEYLYGRLNIIDAKVSSLLTFNSILLAVAAIFVGFQTIILSSLDKWLVKGSAICWLGSTLCCLAISFLKWEHLDSSAGNFNSYRNKIIVVTIRRTTIYNIAIFLIIAALISVSVALGPLLFRI